MTYGQGYEPRDGWPPPSETEPTLYGRRRAPEDDEAAEAPAYRTTEPEGRTGTVWSSTGTHTGAARVPPPAPDLRQPDLRQPDLRQPEPWRLEPRDPELRHPEPRHPELRHPELRHSELRHPELRHPEPRHPEPRHPEPRHPEPRHPELRHSDPRPSPPRPLDRPEWIERPERSSGRFPVSPPPAGEPTGWTAPRPHPQPHPHPTPAPLPHLTGAYPGGGLVPMERPGWPGQVPQQWHEPDVDLPDRRRRAEPGGYDREARHGRAGERPAPKSPPWQTAVGLIAVAVLVAVCAAGGYFMFSDRGPGGSASADGIPDGPRHHDISNRRADPTPLTEAEVFPAPAVATGYQVLKTQALTDCKAAAVGQPVQMLAVQDCSQVVRAVVQSVDQTYVVTLGLFNFGTQVNAEQASDSIKDSVGAQKGRFTGYNLGVPPSDVYARAETQLGWDVRGHFLAYCVVARADAQAIPASDPTAHKIIDDLVEKYLVGTVLQNRVSPPSVAPSTH